MEGVYHFSVKDTIAVFPLLEPPVNQPRSENVLKMHKKIFRSVQGRKGKQNALNEMNVAQSL